MNPLVCPFCGVVTDVRHDTQQACIDALQSEIDLTRRLLERTTETAAAPSLQDDEDRQLT
jgi:hypothetical protein